MIEDFPKLVELGALGLISFYLIFKGIGRMQALTDSIKDLTDSVTKLKNQFDIFESKFNSLENRVNNLENFIKNELRDIKFDIEHLPDFKRKD